MNFSKTQFAWTGVAVLVLVAPVAEGLQNAAEDASPAMPWVTRAVDDAARVTEAGERAMVFAAVAGAAADAGDRGLYEQCVEEAVALLTGLDGWEADAVRSALIWSRARAGDMEQAMRDAASIADESMRIRSLAFAAEAVADRDQRADYDRAMAAAMGALTAMTDPMDRDEAIVQICEALARAKEFDRAVTLAMRASHELSRADALASVAWTRASKGDPEGAGEVLKQAEAHLESGHGNLRRESRYEQSMMEMALAGVAGARAAMGDVERALELTETVEDVKPRARVLAEVAVARSKAGETAQAKMMRAEAMELLLADEEASPWDRYELGMLVIAIEVDEKADEVMERLGRPADRAFAAMGVADGLLARHLAEQGQAREEVGEAWAD